MENMVKISAAIGLLGLLFFTSVTARADHAHEEIKLFRDYMAKAEQGDPKAQVNVANSYYLGTGVDKDIKQALVWYRKAAEQGNDWGQVILGTAYYGERVCRKISSRLSTGIARPPIKVT